MGEPQPAYGRTDMAPGECRPTILLVEDEVLIRQLLSEQLRENACTVHEARDAQEAMTIMASGIAFDALVTDVQMPGRLDGIGLARFVRSAFPGTRLVIMSGRFDPGTLDLKVDRFFVKPFDAATAAEQIVALLRESKSSAHAHD